MTKNVTPDQCLKPLGREVTFDYGDSHHQWGGQRLTENEACIKLVTGLESRPSGRGVNGDNAPIL